MPMYRRRLPHIYRTEHPVFLTWRLHGSLPAGRHFCDPNISAGKAFVAFDRLLDGAREGTFYLRQEPIARMVVESFRHQAHTLHHYDLHAFVVMPNHVHVLLTPNLPLPKLTKSLKSYTARRANEILAVTGPFWQQETFDRIVRSDNEFDRITRYIENNPVHAGLVSAPEYYRWSSAWPARRPAAEQALHPPT